MGIGSKPKIFVKENSQKGGFKFSTILTPAVLSEITFKLFGETDYDIVYDSTGYNKGRLATFEHEGDTVYVSLSDHGRVEGRNSFFQSVATAFISFKSSHVTGSKSIAFYFLPTITGNFQASYFQFMYRILATIGIRFLNEATFLGQKIYPFTSLDDLIAARTLNKARNASNNATYITRIDREVAQVFGKTFGANKKESTLISFAVASLVKKLQVFEICEKDLVTLPAPDRQALELAGNIEFISTQLTLERTEFLSDPSFRSPRFTYNLFQKFDIKECAFCDCNVPEIIQGAHVWPIADIKRYGKYSNEQKFQSATDGENGLWLCSNHHKLFDENLITISRGGDLVYDASVRLEQLDFISASTTKTKLGSSIFTSDFKKYLQLRNKHLYV
jgi:hypothetical protein